MRFDFLREDCSKEGDSSVVVVVISGTCCNPVLKVLDEQALLVIEQAGAEAAVAVRVEMMTLSSAYYAAPEEVRRRLARDFAKGGNGVPAVLIDGKAVSFGVPSIERVKTALLSAAGTQTEERNHE